MSSLLIDKLHSSVKGEEPTYVLQFGEQVVQVEFSPYEWSHEVLCVAFPEKILVASLKFQEEFEEEQVEELELKCIEELAVGVRVCCLSWSPVTSLRDVPRSLVLACATADHAVAVYSSNVTDAYTRKVLNNHTNYVNSVSYDGSGDYLASVSDDMTCRVYTASSDYQQHCVFYLGSPGMDVKWDASDRGKLVVGEKCGLVRMYSVRQQAALLSLRGHAMAAPEPLLAIDWSPSNPTKIAAICSNSILLWSTTSPSSCNVVRGVHSQTGCRIRFSRLSDNKIVTIGQPDNALKLFHTNKPYPLTIANLKMANGLSWHHHLPYVCVGVDKNVCLWKIT